MTNFDYLKSEPKFSGFCDAAIAAEKILNIDTAACIISCRRAMESAVKWMYSVDSDLVMPYQDTLVILIGSEEFRDIVNEDILKRMEFIRRAGNRAAHETKTVSYDEAELCLENLFVFLDFVAYCYSDTYEERQFNKALLGAHQEPVVVPSEPSIDLKALIKENEALKEELTARREQQQETYVPKPLDLSEYKTRKIYIDAMLRDAGWVEGNNWFNEVELPGMPNKSEVGFADYVLYDDTDKALAVIEAKRTCKDVAVGRHQAKLYADLLEKQYGRRPVIFLTNGFDTRITDNIYPERKCAGIYSKRVL